MVELPSALLVCGVSLTFVPLWALLVAAEVKVGKVLFRDETTLVRAAAFHVCLQAKAVAVGIFVGEFLALAAVDCLAHYCTPFHSSLNDRGNVSYM